MADIQQTISPIDGRVVVERPLADARDVAGALKAAREALPGWRGLPIMERAACLRRAVAYFERERDPIAAEITRQMGRPIRHAPGEVAGLVERATHMIAIAPEALADLPAEPKPGFTRFIRREPLGVVFVIAPWNYPFLTAVNAILPALMAGNAVILKSSRQTPLAAERFAAAFAQAGLPEGLFAALHLGHDAVERIIANPEVDFVCFTGSVAGGHAVQAAAARRFIGLGLELGGKDPAYVRADAPFEHAVKSLVDGAFFNAGQSCCAIERIYVQRALYPRFVEAYVDLVRQYRLGDPLDPETTLGPLVRTAAAGHVRAQIDEAVAAGARALIDPAAFAADAPGAPFMAPQVLVEVDHAMRVMREESFGPVIGIMPVGSDEEAISLMNDSAYGLTASIWTADEGAALAIGARLETGTVFMNRCDYLDPALAWTGVKDSGRGCTLSTVGYEHLTRPKSFHFRNAGF